MGFWNHHSDLLSYARRRSTAVRMFSLLSLRRVEVIGCLASTLHEKENLARAEFWRHAYEQEAF